MIDDFDKLADSKAKILRDKIAAKLFDESGERNPGMQRLSA